MRSGEAETLKKTLFYISTILAVAYVVGSFFWTSAARREATCTGIAVHVKNPNDSLRFITDKFILSEIERLGFNVKGKRLTAVDEERIERSLDSQYYVEHVQCYTRSDNSLCVDVEPVQPVMRVFDGGSSYYINRAGKHVPANAGFFLDVPVVCGHFSKKYQPTQLLPLIDYLNEHPEMDELVSAIEVKNPRNVMITPQMAGLTVNLGDLSDLDKKFAKLRRFYREVLPVKGWDFYDTITLKWHGQIVASKRVDKPRLKIQQNTELGHEESPDPLVAVAAGEAADTTAHKQTVRQKNN